MAKIPDKWNGIEEWSLLTLIDDATSDIPNAQFFKSETTWGCLTVLRRVIELKGIPEFILTDCAGWSTGGQKRRHFSQFVRACEELDIRVISTPSPECKGRVERSNRTFQDRLVPELKLYGITSMIDSNRYLQQVFLPHWRETLTVEPRSETKRYRGVPIGQDLGEIFCLKYDRQVNRDHTFYYNGQRYKINPGALGSLWKRSVKIHEYEDSSFQIFYQGKCLSYQKIIRPIRQWEKKKAG